MWFKPPTLWQAPLPEKLSLRRGVLPRLNDGKNHNKMVFAVATLPFLCTPATKCISALLPQAIV